MIHLSTLRCSSDFTVAPANLRASHKDLQLSGSTAGELMISVSAKVKNIHGRIFFPLNLIAQSLLQLKLNYTLVVCGWNLFFFFVSKIFCQQNVLVGG